MLATARRHVDDGYLELGERLGGRRPTRRASGCSATTSTIAAAPPTDAARACAAGVQARRGRDRQRELVHGRAADPQSRGDCRSRRGVDSRRCASGSQEVIEDGQLDRAGDLLERRAGNRPRVTRTRQQEAARGASRGVAADWRTARTVRRASPSRGVLPLARTRGGSSRSPTPAPGGGGDHRSEGRAARVARSAATRSRPTYGAERRRPTDSVARSDANARRQPPVAVRAPRGRRRLVPGPAPAGRDDRPDQRAGRRRTSRSSPSRRSRRSRSRGSTMITSSRVRRHALTPGRLLASGERLELSPRCRLMFGLPSAASTTAVLDLIRRPTAASGRSPSHSDGRGSDHRPGRRVARRRAAELERPIVLHVSRGGSWSARREPAVDGRPPRSATIRSARMSGRRCRSC